MPTAPPLDPAFVAAAAELVRQRTGLSFEGNRRPQFEAGLAACMGRAGIRHGERYLAELWLQANLLDDLLEEITVGETYFFRDLPQLELIRDTALPALAASRGGRPVRIWSAGCASGEEPYTIAMLLRQSVALPPATILGTDLSRAALDRARRARYSKWSLRSTSDGDLQRYFVVRQDIHELSPPIRAAVEFRYLNLGDDDYAYGLREFEPVDVIVCRNVLIYLDPPNVAAVAQRLVRTLSDDGWLIMGASDPPLAGIAPVEVVSTSAGIVYRRQRAPVVVAAATSARAQPPSLSSPPSAPPAKIDAKPYIPESAAATRYAARDYQSAADLAESAVRENPDDMDAWIVMVRSLANHGRLDAAQSAVESAIARHANSAELAYLQGLLLVATGRDAEAVVAMRRATQLDSTLVIAYIALGSVLVRLRDRAGAARAFTAAERLLEQMPPDEPVPGADGAPAARLAAAARTQRRMIRRQNT